MPTLASPLRAGVASPLLWPTARRSASSIWTTTPWVRLKKTPLDSHYPMPIQEPGTISCHGDSHSREGQIEGGLGGNRGTTCVDDQLDNQQVGQRSITTHGPGLLYAFTHKSQCSPPGHLPIVSISGPGGGT